MIYTNIRSSSRYYPIHERLERTIQAMLELRAQPFKAGRHPVDGDDIYINAAEYDTKPQEKTVMEAHRAYIDVMLLLEGEERIAVCDIAAAGAVVQDYNAAGDALLAELPEKVSTEFMRPDDIAVLFPEDCHAPGLNTDGTHRVRKLIAKIRV